MTIRTFRAPSMKEALVRVRQELGSGAVILHTKEAKRGGFLGFGGKPVVEVTASVGVNVRPRGAAVEQRAKSLARAYGQPPPVVEDTPPVNVSRSLAEPAVAPDVPATGIELQCRPDSGSAGPGSGALTADLPPVAEQLSAIRELVEGLVDAQRRHHLPDVPDSLYQVFTSLIENEVSEELAHQLIERLREDCSPEELADAEGLDRRLVELVEGMIDTSGPLRCVPGEPRAIALVGPTGVGKTTTIAKLAAIYKLRRHASVGLVTVDTYRIAAVDQLRRYAEIIDVPLDVVNSAGELKTSLQRMKQIADLVFIDTAGRSPRDDLRIGELRSLMEAAAPDEIHLVLSLVASESHLRAAIDNFAVLGANHVLLTKLDEAMTYGIVLRLLSEVNRKLSYITTGQKVPDDIEPGRKTRLANLILGKETIHG